MTLLFASAHFLSALLLFVVQPLVGRLVTPQLGGVPAVWTTCMAFFQTCLLVGYAYSHWLSTRASLPRQVLAHVGLLLAALLTLPVSVAVAPALANHAPALALLWPLVIGVAAPVCLLSATAPLLQGWLAAGDATEHADPYYLYAASNAGSFAALLLYPLLIERLWTLDTQALAWTVGFVAFTLLVVATGVRGLRRRRAGAAPVAKPTAPAPLAGATRWRWAFFAFVPSTLLVSVTTHLSAQFATIPLIWVAPLALYLLTYIIAFARQASSPTGWPGKAAPYALLAVAPLVTTETPLLSWLLVPVTLVVFFVLALLAHQRLAASRPHVSRLTDFYLMIAVGGGLGGVFNAFVAPLVFDSYLEYQIGLVLAATLLPYLDQAGPRFEWRDLAYPVALAISCGLLTLTATLPLVIPRPWLARTLVIGVPAIVCFGFKERPLRFALGFAAIAWTLMSFVAGSAGQVLAQQRNFFGVKTVLRDHDAGVDLLAHGSVRHGAQYLEASRRDAPLAYYDRTGPAGDCFQVLAARPGGRRVAVIGLGVGSLAAYAGAEDALDFLEVDPAVAALAVAHFSFLEQCGHRCRVEVGDGRALLGRAADHSYDLVVVDAFAGGNIPSHLLTREALDLYLQKLAPGGLVAFHVSNRFFDLAAVLAAAVAANGSVAVLRVDSRPQPGPILSSHWVAVAATTADLAALRATPGWTPLTPTRNLTAWTDQRTDIIAAMRW